MLLVVPMEHDGPLLRDDVTVEKHWSFESRVQHYENSVFVGKRTAQLYIPTLEPRHVRETRKKTAKQRAFKTGALIRTRLELGAKEKYHRRLILFGCVTHRWRHEPKNKEKHDLPRQIYEKLSRAESIELL